MRRYLLERTAVFCLTIWAAATLNFVIVHITPQDPIAAVLGRMASRGASVEGGAQIVALYTEAFGLDQPLWVQYLVYLSHLARGDLGYSLAYFPEKVSAVVLHAVPWTVGLLMAGILVAFALGNLIGALAAWPRSPVLIRSIFLAAMTLSAIPFYFLALILLYVFAFAWPILPIGGTFSLGSTRGFGLQTAFEALRHAALPIASISLGLIGFWALNMRGVMTMVLGEDYLGYARVKGLKERTVFLHYGLRNAMLPQVTSLAIDLGRLISGQLLVETVFNYPGLGTVLYNALRAGDYPVIQGVVLLTIIAVACMMLLVELAYPLLDPRISLGGRSS